MKYAVTVFSASGYAHTVNNLESGAAFNLADETRPIGGSSYVHDETHTLVFKPYRQTRVLVPGYNPPGKRRLSAVSIEAAAKRFEADGEYDNAQAMRELMK